MQAIDVKALTWNLNKSQAALNLALGYLSAISPSVPAIAALQETPGEIIVPSALSLCKPAPKVGTRIPSGIALVHNAALQPIGSVVGDVDGEFVAQKFCHTAGDREFWLVSIHATSQATDEVDTLEGRGGCRALLRHRINEIYGSDPIVMLGDFNSEASSNEINFWNAFYALDNDHFPNTTAGYEKRCDRAHAALEVAVPSSALKFAGTYLYKRKARMFDFIVHDEITKVANATVQTSLRGTPLWQPNATKTRGNIIVSDHLPVTADIKI